MMKKKMASKLKNENNDKKNNVAGIIVVGIIVLFVAFSLMKPSAAPGQFDAFAQCLTDKGAVMYGTEWCSHCKDQKALFEDSFARVNYVDCDKNMQKCLDAGVEGYPTWVIMGENYPGIQPLLKLSELSGCAL
ncbi:MAG: thioredoxin domain-containing protein [archaeon]